MVQLPTVEGSVEINAPVEHVYAIYMDLDNVPKLVDDVEEVERLSDERSMWTFRHPNLPRGTAKVEVTLVATSPNKRAEWRAVEKPLVCRAVTVFHSLDGNRTRIDHRTEYTVDLGLGTSRLGVGVTNWAGSALEAHLLDAVKLFEHMTQETLRKGKELAESTAG
ncbi:SRPBCC family protein [Streptomyces sp. NPDC048337]|uniref:SRPBCC family protein n=1 Tax=Streptomyces sp. NPDC048337 TaxID=3365535 RepID=UPI0037156C8E